MLNSPIARRLGGLGGGDEGAPPPGPDEGMEGPEPTGASDDAVFQDFLNNPNPQLADVVEAVKALIRDDQSDDSGGGPAAPPPGPPPGAPPM